jgi:hypothetical protein
MSKDSVIKTITGTLFSADQVAAIEALWADKCRTYQELMDATAKDADRAYELLRRVETEMRYAGWNKYEPDNSARNGVYEQVKEFLK